MSAVINNINLTKYRSYTFIKNINITQYPCYGANEARDRYSVNFTLNQTKFFIVSHLLDDGESTPPPGLVIVAHHAYPKMSPSVRFEPPSSSSWENLRFSLEFCLGLNSKEQEAVMDEIYKDLTIYYGYNQGFMMHLSITINQIVVVHLRAKLCSIAPLDDMETRHIWANLCSIAAVDDRETRQSESAKVDEVVVQGGGGEENCCVCFEELANQEQLVGLSCKHVFHEGCIVKWLGNSLSCPLCRFRLDAVLS